MMNGFYSLRSAGCEWAIKALKEKRDILKEGEDNVDNR